MASATLYLQKKLLDHAMGKAAFSMPAAVYLALLTADPGEAGSLAGEVTGGSYARVELTSRMDAAILGTGVSSNNTAVTFATPSADWGTITHLAICDAASGGNALFHGPLTSSQVVSNGSVAPSFADRLITVQASSTIIESFEVNATQYLAKKWLDHALGKAAWTMPPAIYLGLFTGDPTATGSLIDEVAGGSYGRQEMTSKMDVTALSTGLSSNNAAIIFASPTANWNVITHYGIMDALTSGNMLFRKARGSALNVVAGSAAVRISAAQLVLRVD